MKVICPNCKVLCHETTDAFDPDVRPDRSMVELLEPWRAWGHGDGWQDLECPACLSPLAPSGRLRVVSDDHGESMAKKGTEQVMEMFLSDKVYDPTDTLKLRHRVKLTDKRNIYKIPVKILDEDISKAERIREYLGDGLSPVKIAQVVGTSPAYVSNVARKMREANG